MLLDTDEISQTVVLVKRGQRIAGRKYSYRRSCGPQRRVRCDGTIIDHHIAVTLQQQLKMPVGRNETLARPQDAGGAGADADIASRVGDDGAVELAVRGPAVPGRFIDDDAAVVFQVQPLGIGAASAAVPECSPVDVINHQIAVSLENRIRSGMSLRSGAPCAGAMRPVIDEK